MSSALTGYIDVAQVTLYAFWIFFAGLLFHLRRQDRREGYPLEEEQPRGRKMPGFNFLYMPFKKDYNLPHGGTYETPVVQGDDRVLAATATAPWPGAPIEPTGDPMRDGLGAAAWAPRRDEPELTFDGLPLIIPMRVAPNAMIATRDPDPRGMTVVAADRVAAGTVVDAWIDQAEPQIRYLEVELAGGAGGGTVLLPMTLAKVRAAKRQIVVESVMAHHFPHVPRTQHPERVTKLEEDKISAYFAGGHLYATPERLGPLL